MAFKKKPDEEPIKDYCCGSYCSEARCCSHSEPKQQEMFPDSIREYAPHKKWIDVTPRKETRPLNNKKPYEKITVPDWVKKRQDRDTDSNLE